MKLTEIYAKKDKVVSFEIFPPKRQEELDNIDATLTEVAKLHPDYVSVTFGAGGSSNNNKTIAIAKKIKDEYGIEPVVHLTGLCYDEAEIDAFVEEIKAAGIENILALRGDENPNATPKGVFPHAVDLIKYLRKTTGDYFCIAAACYPENHPETPDTVTEILRMRAKADAGADIFLSQLFFDNNSWYEFEDHCHMAGINVPITPGIMPAINSSQIKRMVTLCGATLPLQFEKIVNKYGDNKEAMLDAGIAYAQSQIIDLLTSDCDGIHLYIMNNPKVAKRLCDAIVNFI